MFTEMLLYFGNNWYIDNDSFFIGVISWDWNIESVSLEYLQLPWQDEELSSKTIVWEDVPFLENWEQRHGLCEPE